MNNINRKKAVLWLVPLVMLTLALMGGPDLWAAPGQSLERQTVPTRTPSPSPTEHPTTQPMPTPTALTTPVISEATSTGASSGPFLPESGGWNIRPHLGAAMIVVGLLVLMVVVGRRA